MKFLKSVAEFINWHRRAVAALLAALSVVSIAGYLKEPPPDQRQVVVAKQTINPGETITSQHVSVEWVSQSAAPVEAFASTDAVVGSEASISVPPNMVLTSSMLIQDFEAEPGRSLVPVSLHDEQLQALLTPGIRVTLVLPPDFGGDVVTDDAVIAALPPRPEGSALAPRVGAKPLVLMNVPEAVAGDVATLGQQGVLAVILGGSHTE